MTNAQLEEVLKALGKDQYEVKGDIGSIVYACPTRDWLSGDFSAALRPDLRRLGARKYVPARNDCTDFSLYAMAVARLCHNATTQSRCALAFGTIDYFKQSADCIIPTGHRINFSVVRENDLYRLVFFEPQLPGLIELTQEEQDSVYHYHV